MTPPDAPTPPRIASRRRQALLILVVVGLLGGAAWRFTRPQPKQLFSQALAMNHRDPGAAERLFRRAIDAAGGKYPDAQVGLCAALARQGDWKEAQRQFATIDPSSCRADVLLEFGREALDADRISEAQTSLQTIASREARESQESLELLLAGYRRWGFQHELIVVCQQLTKSQPDRFDVWAVLVEVLRGMKLEKECLEAASEALEHDPPEEYRREFQYLMVEMLITRAEAARGTIELATLRDLEGDTLRVRACTATLYRLEGRLDESLKAAATLLSEIEGKAIAHLIRGSVWLDLGEYEKAVGDLRQAVAAQPFNAQAHFKLSEALRALGDKAEALNHSRIANELSSKRLVINSLLKQRAAAAGKDPLVAAQLARLFEEIGDETSAAHWTREADAARKSP